MCSVTFLASLPVGPLPPHPDRHTWCWPSRPYRTAQTKTSEPGEQTQRNKSKHGFFNLVCRRKHYYEILFVRLAFLNTTLLIIGTVRVRILIKQRQSMKIITFFKWLVCTRLQFNSVGCNFRNKIILEARQWLNNIVYCIVPLLSLLMYLPRSMQCCTAGYNTTNELL